MIWTTSLALGQALLPPPVPQPNQITEPKRILGKLLFWDEQLSSDNTVACGTCHIPGVGWVDPRVGRNPGIDKQFNTADDVLGSPGVVHMDSSGAPIEDPVFGFDPQVTRRAAPNIVMAAYAPGANFWDGRAGPQFINPLTQQVVLPNGGALENQSLVPILSSIEMGHEGRTWDQVLAKLQASRPMALASHLPPDMAAAVNANSTYAGLFQAAFGDPNINPVRIAFAIATYERTLVPNQTPWDAFVTGNQNALTPQQRAGLTTFNGPGRCVVCHTPPLFTNNTFRNIGVRPPAEDLGRFEVTQQLPDRGRFRVPSLRNGGLRSRFMHNGRLETMEQVIDFYRRANGQVQFPENQDPIIPAIAIPPQAVAGIVDFLRNGLTDPRVANEQFPFDRPKLRSELLDGDLNCDGVANVSDIGPFVLTLTDPTEYANQFPNCFPLSADLNLDGTVSVADIGGFVDLLTQ